MTRLLRDQRGVVMLEFLVALLPVMVMFLGLIQFSFIAGAKLLLRHSAAVAARAAVVVLEDSADLPGASPDLYSAAPAGLLQGGGGQRDAGSSAGLSEQGRDAMRKAASSGSRGDPILDQLQGLTRAMGRNQTRLRQIQTAAYLPLLAVSPDAADEGLGSLAGLPARSGAQDEPSVRDAIGGTASSHLLGSFLYNLGMVAVTFPQKPGARELRRRSYDVGDDVTVRVSYLFRCKVPVASLLLCDSGLGLLEGSGFPDWSRYRLARALGQSFPENLGELPAWQARAGELGRNPGGASNTAAFKGRGAEFDNVEAPDVQRLLLLRGGSRYMVLQSEATLPLQGARYYPRDAASSWKDSV